MFRRSAHWMTQQDDRILEYLAEEAWATPSQITMEASVDVSEGFVEERVQFLGYAGLVDRIHAEMYEITGWGRLYLEGELDAHHQPTPTAARALEKGW